MKVAMQHNMVRCLSMILVALILLSRLMKIDQITLKEPSLAFVHTVKEGLNETILLPLTLVTT